MLVKRLRFPKGADKYKEMDLKVLPDERVERIVEMSPLSRLRGFVLAALLSAFGLALYAFFCQPELTAESLALPVAVFLALYFLWHCMVTESAKQLAWSLLKYGIYVVLLSYLLAFLAAFFVPLLWQLKGVEAMGALSEGSKAPSFSLDPIENLHGLLAFAANLLKTFAVDYAPYARLLSLALVTAGLAALPLLYFYARGHLYYLSDRRIVVRRKFGTVQVTTFPLDSVVEVTAFQGLSGRLFGYGDVTVTMTSGGGVTDSLQPTSAAPLRGLYTVKRRLEGIRDPWEIKDLIIVLREKYVQTHYLERMEGELRRIREGIEGRVETAETVERAESL